MKIKEEIKKYKDYLIYREKIINELDSHESVIWYNELKSKLSDWSVKLVFHYYDVESIKFHCPSEHFMKVFWVYKNGGTYTDESILPLDFLDRPEFHIEQIRKAELHERLKKEEEIEKQKLRKLVEKHSDFAKTLI